MPSFRRVLNAIIRAYQDQPADVQKTVGQLLTGLAKERDSANKPTLLM